MRATRRIQVYTPNVRCARERILCITFRVRVAVDGRRELSLNRARDTRETRICRFLRVACSTRACVCMAYGARSIWPGSEPLTMLFESAATKTYPCRTALGVRQRRFSRYDRTSNANDVQHCILVIVVGTRHLHRWEKRKREGKISRPRRGLSKPCFRRNKIIIATPHVMRGGGD